MPHTLGIRFGSYEVTALIGAGGMGEVYRAMDTNLKRAVALKVLPASVAADPERLARFQREAELLAALDHPNIAAIYGLDRSGPAIALVMELVEGEDLSERMSRGPLPIDEAIPLAKQIAEALEAAHERGIVHRDLKPANIKVRPDGTVKVLDFGLAKGFAPDDAVATPGDVPLPTMTSPAMLTSAGMILGTAAYMSPEQARGRVVDKRADIWAFGVVLFEFLTGKPLFVGETISDTLASVLRQEVPFATLPAATPAPVRQLLQRCLERDPRRRLRDIGEARLLLEAGDYGGVFRNPGEAANVPRGHRPWMRPAVIAVPWILLIALAAFTVWRRSNDRDAAAPGIVRAVLPHAEAGVISGRIAITPDGRDVIFAASRDGVSRLVVRPLDRFEHRVLAGTEGAEGPFVSPDGRWIGFFAADRMKRVPLAGGTVEDLAEVPRPITRAAVWTARGEIITMAPGMLVRVPERGGTPVPLRDSDGRTLRGNWPVASADGRHLVFMQGGSGGVEDDFLHTLSLDTGAIQKTSIVTRDPVAMIAGHVLFRRQDTALMAVRFDEERGEINGEPFQVLEPSTTAAVSPTGTAVYVADDGRVTMTIRDGGRSQAVWQPAWPVREPRVSSNGNAIAVVRDISPPEVWVYDIDTATPTRIADRGIRPEWSSARHIVYLRSMPGLQPPREIFSRPSDASAPETLVFATESMRLQDVRMTPDGKNLLLTAQTDANTLFRVPLTGDRTPMPIVRDEPGLTQVRLSPDATWVAYTSTSSGSQEVYARRLSGAGMRLTVSSGGGNEPIWRPDGRGIYYRQGDRFVLATVEVASTPHVVKRETALTGDFARRGRWSYDVMPDGRLLVLEPMPGSTRMIMVHDWISEVRDRLTASPR